jgi:enoyl-CoA hydratase
MPDNAPHSFARLDQDGDVSILTLDDGKVNAFSFDMVAAVNACLDRVPSERGALLIKGRPGVLSGGFDLKVIRGGDPDRLYSLVEEGAKLIWRIATFPRPVVVACAGHGVALGAFLLLVADWRVGAEGPYRLGLNEVRDGLPLPAYFRELARSRIPAQWFMRCFMHAEMFEPADAIAPGFLDMVVPGADLDATVMTEARRLAKLPHPAYRIAKERDRNRMAEAVFRDFRSDVSGALDEALSV